VNVQTLDAIFKPRSRHLEPTLSTGPDDEPARARPIPSRPLARLRFRLVAIDPLSIRAYRGSARCRLPGRGLRQSGDTGRQAVGGGLHDSEGALPRAMRPVFGGF
jgi:hypothetical protein